MKRKIKISETQYRNIFLKEQKPDHLMPGQSDYGIPGGVMGLMSRGDLTNDEKGEILVTNARKQHKASMEMAELLGIKQLIDIFHCGSDTWKTDVNGETRDDYWHCVLDNISIAVSVVPVFGTIASAIFDLANAVYYGYDFLDSCDTDDSLLGFNMDASKCNWWDLGGVIFSAAGIIPGVTEARALKRLNKKSIDAGNKTMKAIYDLVGGNPNRIKNIKPDKVEKIFEKYGKGLSKGQKKDLAKYFKIMQDLSSKSSTIKQYSQKLNALIKTNKWSRSQLLDMYESKLFKKLMRRNKNDLLKTLKQLPAQKALNTLKWQAGLTMGLTLGLYHGINTVRWLIDRKGNSNIIDAEEFKEEIKIVDKYGEFQLMALFQLFNVFSECNPTEGKINFKEFWGEMSKGECPSRNAALYAAKKGLVLEIPTDNKEKRCPCYYVKDQKQWDIIIKSFKKYLPDRYQGALLMMDSCLDDEMKTEACPELFPLIELPEITIYSDPNKK